LPELGAKDILQKPYEFDKMLVAVRSVLDGANKRTVTKVE
jgi:DNA-binding response OmpR family regulator